MSGNHTFESQRNSTAITLPNPQQLNSIYPEELIEPNKGIDLREFWRVIMRRKKMLILFVLATFLLALLLTLLMKPVYRASTTIQIEREPTRSVDLVLQPSTARNERDFWQTQIELIRSKRLASTVIEKLSLADSLSPQPGLLSFLKREQPPIEVSFLEGLTVEPLNNSQIFLISYESNDPEQAKVIANTIAETYIEMNFQRRFESARTAKKFIEEEIAQQERRLFESQRKLQQYERDNNITRLDGQETTRSHTVRKLTEELISIQKNRITLESELQQLEAVIKSRAPSKAFDHLSLQDLKNQLTKLKKEKSKLIKMGRSPTGKSRSANQKKIDDIQEYLRPKLMRDELNTRYETARNSEEIIKARLEQLKNEANSVSQPHDNLLREVEANKLAFKGLQDSLLNLSVASNIDTQNVTIIDYATRPYKKYKPNIKMNLLFGLLTGLMLGTAAIFLREFMDDSIKDIDELERATDLPLLGTVPYLKRRNDQEIALQIVKEPKSKISEAIRSLRTTLSLSTQEGAPKMTFITSSGPAEGKSTSSVNLAAAYATNGHTVLLIDADLRSPSIHSLLNLDPRQGLSNYLTDNCELNTIIQSTSIPGLYSVVAGSLPPDPVELLSGNRMREMLDRARAQYDFIIIDGPPVLGLADALVLSNLADATILAVHSGNTRKGQISTSVKRLKQSQGHLVGTLLNHTTPQKSGYSYEYLHYSYSHAQKKGFFRRLFG